MQFVMKYSLYMGILINVGYTLVKRYIMVDDTTAIVIGIISIVLMMAGLIYNGWCLGKGINPFTR